MNKVILKCFPLKFYTQTDESLCFKWIKKIKSIIEIKGIGRELHLFFNSNKIPDKDLLELIGLFDRYNFDENQLKIFMNETNKEWFEK